MFNHAAVMRRGSGSKFQGSMCSVTVLRLLFGSESMERTQGRSRGTEDSEAFFSFSWSKLDLELLNKAQRSLYFQHNLIVPFM